MRDYALWPLQLWIRKVRNYRWPRENNFTFFYIYIRARTIPLYQFFILTQYICKSMRRAEKPSRL